MFIDLSPILKNTEFRKLFFGQTISFLGSMMSYVAIPFQIYEITKSSFLVGLVSTIQLVPLLIAGLYGGALADMIDRRKLLLWAEFGLFITTLLFVMNCFLPEPSVVLIFVVAAVSSSLVGVHRPAMDALTPQIVEPSQMTAVSAIGSLQYSLGAVVGPAIGGVLISKVGIAATYALDATTFLFSIFCLYRMKSVAIPGALEKVNWSTIKEGVKYAIKTPVIFGTYIVDLIAMLFAWPMALFPQIADEMGQKKEVGLLYASMAIGAGIAPLISRPLDKIKRQGAGVIVAATFWGVFVTIMAFGGSIYFITAALVLAGAADSVSAIFRKTIWNEVIPTNIRGRLGSLNMISYMTGPLLGNLRAGSMASFSNTFISVLSGGILCTIACLACIRLLPKFWEYKRREN